MDEALGTADRLALERQPREAQVQIGAGGPMPKQQDLVDAREFQSGGNASDESTLPLHKHPYEQTGYLVSGRMRLTIAGEQFDATRGASWCIPADVLHDAEILEDSVAIEIFSPVRPDYRPAADQPK